MRDFLRVHATHTLLLGVGYERLSYRLWATYLIIGCLDTCGREQDGHPKMWSSCISHLFAQFFFCFPGILKQVARFFPVKSEL